jgi:hypothetical protein
MAREKKMLPKRTLLSLTPEQKEAVRDFRFANRLNTEQEALRLLLDLGLKAAPKAGWKAK